MTKYLLAASFACFLCLGLAACDQKEAKVDPLVVSEAEKAPHVAKGTCINVQVACGEVEADSFCKNFVLAEYAKANKRVPKELVNYIAWREAAQNGNYFDRSKCSPDYNPFVIQFDNGNTKYLSLEGKWGDKPWTDSLTAPLKK